MDQNTKKRIQALDSLSFQSLSLIGIDWRKILKENSELMKEYYSLLSLRKDYLLVNL